MYTMMQVCKQTGMTYQGLKFYCNEGLVPNVKRDKNNKRVFDDRDVAWIKSLRCLRNCGIGIQEMKEYVKLCLEGPSTIQERKAILKAKRADVLRRIKELKESVKYLDEKQKFYDEVLAGKRKYTSNLLSCFYDEEKGQKK